MNKKELIYSFFQQRVGVLATMHHKEKVIQPILETELGIKVKIPPDFDTDRFGTFTRDVERMGDQLEAAKHKVNHALQVTGETIGISSEGVFGPHPFFPFVAYNREVVLLIDKEHGLEVVGESVTTDTNYSHKKIKNFEEANEFCASVGFPEHGVTVRVEKASDITKDEIIKGITTKEHLFDAISIMLAKSTNREVIIETDMRALYNPRRMKNIELATKDLIHKIYTLCPNCSFPGFKLVGRKKGLLCGGCGIPTELIYSETYSCNKCKTTEEKLYPKGIEKADPSQCQFCNP